tara:strand:+ start:1540 stop:2289 length:750 start_codon:yes stop_codon:yes gene_type:complete
MIFLAGLPRTGSTLLTSILSQNSNIHAEGNSGLCQLMIDMKTSCIHNEQIKANYREQTQTDLLKEIPKIYYKGVDNKIIIDKCRSWGSYTEIINDYITEDPKFIVMLRPIEEIFASMVNLRMKNNYKTPFSGLLDAGSNPIMNSYDSTIRLIEKYSDKCVFVTYNDLIDRTKDTLDKIYNFCNIPEYQHQFDNIVNVHQENDEVYGLLGMHKVRNKIRKSEYKVDIPKIHLLKCKKLDSHLNDLTPVHD